jgi:aminoglycoside phosphotransferase (APT) family kinase protein
MKDNGESDPGGRLPRAALDSLLVHVCRNAGIDPTDAELIKFTNNAVFRLPSASVVVRIAGSLTMKQRADKVVRAAHWFAAHGLPTVRLLAGVQQPMVIDGNVATLWQAVPEVGPAPTGADLGRVLRLLHSTTDRTTSLPQWQPLAGIRERLADAEGLDGNIYTFLSSACDELEAALTRVRYILPPGVVHGDATVANLIGGPSGPVICDFDSTSIGPREWDLVPVATGHLRFATAGVNQLLLATEYGLDITTWDGFPVLRRLRELQLVTSVVPVLRSNPSLRSQWRHRLETFRSNDGQARWELYT